MADPVRKRERPNPPTTLHRERLRHAEAQKDAFERAMARKPELRRFGGDLLVGRRDDLELRDPRGVR